MTRDASTKHAGRKKQATPTAKSLAAARGKRSIVDDGETRFVEVIALIEAARQRAYQAVNTELVAHY